MIFIDTNVLVAFAVVKDSNHERALKLVEKLAGNEFGLLFTSDYIFDEATTVILARSKSLKEATTMGEYLLASTNSIKINEDLFKDAWDFFKNQKSTKLSFTDCTNVIAMKSKGIKSIATFDEEFSKVNSITTVSY